MLTKVVLAFCVAVAGVTASTATHAIDVENLQWIDLEPAATDLSDPFADLPDDQYDALIQLLRLRSVGAAKSPLLRSADQRYLDILNQFKDQGVDLEAQIKKYDAILEQRRKTAEAGVVELEARDIKITGYLLPITVEGNKVFEFLLVQSPTACSHTRLPLPNQTILVKPEVPYTFQQYFERVSVSGPIHLRVQKRSLYLLDGKITVTSAYAMNATATRPEKPTIPD